MSYVGQTILFGTNILNKFGTWPCVDLWLTLRSLISATLKVTASRLFMFIEAYARHVSIIPNPRNNKIIKASWLFVTDDIFPISVQRMLFKINR